LVTKIANPLKNELRANMIYSAFEEKNIAYILDVVALDWSAPNSDMEFRRFYAESIVRHNIWDAQFSLQSLDEDGKFLAACFAGKKGYKDSLKKVSDWILARTDGGKTLSAEQKKAFEVSKVYLNMMDEKTFSYMNEDDIKLSLFVSCSKGAGFPLLEKFKEELRARGYKNLYLWTDCECNWNWYNRRGYELVEKGIYEPFSGENEPYETFVFRQSLLK